MVQSRSSNLARIRGPRNKKKHIQIPTNCRDNFKTFSYPPYESRYADLEIYPTVPTLISLMARMLPVKLAAVAVWGVCMVLSFRNASNYMAGTWPFEFRYCANTIPWLVCKLRGHWWRAPTHQSYSWSSISGLEESVMLATCS